MLKIEKTPFYANINCDHLIFYRLMFKKQSMYVFNGNRCTDFFQN